MIETFKICSRDDFGLILSQFLLMDLNRSFQICTGTDFGLMSISNNIFIVDDFVNNNDKSCGHVHY